MITALFFTLCAFAAFHFIYERILQPSLRLLGMSSSKFVIKFEMKLFQAILALRT